MDVKRGYMAFQDQHYAPTAISATFPPIVTLVAHGLQNGQRLRATRFPIYPLANATGMEQLEGREFEVQKATDDTFALYSIEGFPIDATSYTAFINNGLAQLTRTGPELGYENA